MKVKNTLSQKVNLCMPDGKEVVLSKDDVIEMPSWLFETLVTVFPGLKALKEEKLVGEPATIEPVEPKPVETPKKEVKNAKGKKSGK